MIQMTPGEKALLCTMVITGILVSSAYLSFPLYAGLVFETYHLGDVHPLERPFIIRGFYNGSHLIGKIDSIPILMPGTCSPGNITVLVSYRNYINRTNIIPGKLTFQRELEAIRMLRGC